MDWKGQKSLRYSDYCYLCLLANYKNILLLVWGNRRNEMRNTRIAEWRWEGLSVIAHSMWVPFLSALLFHSLPANTVEPTSSVILPTAGLYEGWPLTAAVILLPSEMAKQSAAQWGVLNLMMTCEYKNYVVILMEFGHNFKNFLSTIFKCWGWHNKGTKKKAAHLKCSGVMQCLC